MNFRGKIIGYSVACFAATLALAIGGAGYISEDSDLKAKFTAYEPSAGHPFGRLNPEAPPETAQFSFMVGEFTCDDEARQQDGSWKKTKAFWTASYMMNGYGIQDHFYNEQVAAVSPRGFNKQKRKWVVSYYQMPRFFAGNIWEGEMKDGRMVLLSESKLPNGDTRVSRLTFYNIWDEGYDWKAESLLGGNEEDARTIWKLSCQRRR